MGYGDCVHAVTTAKAPTTNTVLASDMETFSLTTMLLPASSALRAADPNHSLLNHHSQPTSRPDLDLAATKMGIRRPFGKPRHRPAFGRQFPPGAKSTDNRCRTNQTNLLIYGHFVVAAMVFVRSSPWRAAAPGTAEPVAQTAVRPPSQARKRVIRRLWAIGTAFAGRWLGLSRRHSAISGL
jgi:hypothetical protein